MRFLIGVMSAPGHFTPTIPVALELRRRGHEVTYMGDPSLGETVSRLDFPFIGVGPTIDWKRSVPSQYPEMAKLEGWKQSKYMMEHIFLDWIPRLLPEAEAHIRRLRPDCIASDMVTILPWICEKLQIPWATLLLFLNFVPGPEAIPPTLGLGPPKTPIHRLAHRLLYSGLLAMSAGWSRSFNKIRRDYGLPPRPATIADHFVSSWLCLCFTTFDFEFLRTDLPRHFHLVGPSLWDGLDAGEPDGFLPPSSPTVYVTQGTSVSQFRPEFFRTALDALKTLPVEAVMTTGFVFGPNDFAPSPPNVRIAKFIPQSHLLPHMDVVVHHGGHSSTWGAVMAGVPQVVVPFNWDQPDNAARVRERGLGIVLKRKGLTPEKLAEAIRTVLADPGYRQRARELAEKLRPTNAPARAADLLESLARERKPILRIPRPG